VRSESVSVCLFYEKVRISVYLGLVQLQYSIQLQSLLFHLTVYQQLLRNCIHVSYRNLLYTYCHISHILQCKEHHKRVICLQFAQIGKEGLNIAIVD